MGIDEKCFLSGQSYVAVLNDSKGSRVLEVTEGREASAERLFESLGLEQRQKVEAVVMDMSAAFEAAAEAKMPQAEIVHDRFHVSKNLNEAVDKVRRTEHRNLKEQGKETLKGSRFFFSSRRKTSTAGAVPGCATCSMPISKSVALGRSKNSFAISGNVPMRGQL